MEGSFRHLNMPAPFDHLNLPALKMHLQNQCEGRRKRPRWMKNPLVRNEMTGLEAAHYHLEED